MRIKVHLGLVLAKSYKNHQQLEVLVFNLYSFFFFWISHREHEALFSFCFSFMPLENIVDSLHSCFLSPEVTSEYFLTRDLSSCYQSVGFVLTMTIAIVTIGSLPWIPESSMNAILSYMVGWETRPYCCPCVCWFLVMQAQNTSRGPHPWVLVLVSFK